MSQSAISAGMMNFRNRLNRSNTLAFALGMAGAMVVAGCGDDDSAGSTTNENTSDDEDASTSNDNTTNDTNDTTTDETNDTTEASASSEDPTSSADTSDEADAGGASDAGATSGAEDDAGDAGTEISSGDDSGVDAGPPVEPETSFIVGGWIYSTDVWYGVLGVVDDLSSNNTLDIGSVVSFDAEITYTGYNGAVYVGHEANPIIEKWVVNGDGQLEMAGDVSFMEWGVVETHGASSNVIQIIDDNTGWFFDHANGRVMVFNPSDMSTTGQSIDYNAIYDGIDFDANDWPDVGDVGRVGDHIAVPMFYYSGVDETIPVETTIALINTTNNDVSIIKDTRCAGSSVMSNDSDGNLYFGPHAAAAGWAATGSAGDMVPCVIRILNGQTEVDQDYLVNLYDLSGGKPVAGLYQGHGDKAYVFQFDGALAPGEGPATPEWSLHSIDLASTEPGYTQVAGWPLGSPSAIAFHLQVGTETKYYITRDSDEEDGANSAYYEILPDGTIEAALNFPIFPGHAVNY